MEKEYLPNDDTNEVSEPMAAYGAVVPGALSPALLMDYINEGENLESYFVLIKKYSQAPDELIAYWLNINVKTYRSYRKGNATVRPDIKEHIIILATFMKHGVEVFESSIASFSQWLHTENFMLDKKKPADLLNTNSGVRFLDDQLTNMEYGINA